MGLSGAVPADPRPAGGVPMPVPAGAVKGDFDGDGAPELAWAVPPPLTPGGMDCVGECRCSVQFSNPAIKPLAIGKYIGGALTNLGDLNNDGKDDLGVLPDWFTSCWRSYLVFSYAHGRWAYAVPPFAVHCNEMESGVKPIEKDPAHPGYVIERYSEFTEAGIVVKTKSVAVN
ncbi:hypothetical protein AXW84_17475 [Hymenobacter sp. PAMC 26628]|nr:hypothetical protein AXW84_17475 [Hymenobacter sp. PAMC 26628]